MKKYILSIFLGLSLLLAGCVTLPAIKDIQVLEKFKYIVLQVPEEMFEITPTPSVPKASTETGVVDDKQVSKFIVDLERRSSELEDKILAIKKFLEDKIKYLNIPKDDVILK